MSPVVPKVTAYAETAVLWHIMNGDLAKAREIVSGMLPGEAAEYEERLSLIVRWLWEAQNG